MNERYEIVAKLFRENASSDFSIAPATEQEIATVEKELGVKLPESYRLFQLEFGDFDWGVLDIISVKTPKENMMNIVGISRMEQNECHPKMPVHLIPFGDNGGGDSYCFDTSNYQGSECSIVFWDHEADEKQQPEVVASNFLDWIEKEINWRLESDA